MRFNSPVYEKIIDTLKKGPCTARQLTESTGASHSSVKEALRKMRVLCVVKVHSCVANAPRYELDNTPRKTKAGKDFRSVRIIKMVPGESPGRPDIAAAWIKK